MILRQTIYKCTFWVYYKDDVISRLSMIWMDLMTYLSFTEVLHSIYISNKPAGRENTQDSLWVSNLVPPA